MRGRNPIGFRPRFLWSGVGVPDFIIFDIVLNRLRLGKLGTSARFLSAFTIFAEDRRRFGNLLRASPRDCSHLSLSLRKINFREVRYGSTTRQLFALHPARAFFAEQAKKSSFPTGGHSERTAPGDEEKISTNGIEQDTIRLSGSGSVCPGYGRGASVPAALAGDAGARQ